MKVEKKKKRQPHTSDILSKPRSSLSQSTGSTGRHYQLPVQEATSHSVYGAYQQGNVSNQFISFLLSFFIPKAATTLFESLLHNVSLHNRQSFHTKSQ